jgi:hypothetical protein
LRDLPAIALTSIPPVVWRAETGFRHDADTSAADVIRHERDTLGKPLALLPALLDELDTYPACALLWVTFTRADALRYGANVKSIRLDLAACVIASDDAGGFLLFFSDDLAGTGGIAMPDPLDDNAAQLRGEIKAEIYDEVAAARELKRESLAGEIAAHLHTASSYGPSDEGFLEFVRAQVKIDRMTSLGQAVLHGDESPALSNPPRAGIDDDDEERRRAGRGGGGDMGNPAHAQLAANIRPDVTSGPAGLETITTQKSADYHIEDNASDYIRERLAEAERSANQPTMTVDAIARDPWNAVELPLPANADADLLKAPRSELIEQRSGEQSPDPARDYIADRIARGDEGPGDEALTPDQMRQIVGEESVKQQEAERPARDDETSLRDVSSPATGYIAERLAEAEKAERESEGQEFVTQDHGQAHAPGGGARGIF